MQAPPHRRAVGAIAGTHFETTGMKRAKFACRNAIAAASDSDAANTLP